MSNSITLNQSRPQIQALTSLRFIAAFFILILHAKDHELIPASFLHSVDLSKSVAFFFVLSGFVLAYAYTNRNYRKFAFYQSRFARIWPATFASILFTLIILPRSFILPSIDSDWTLGAVFAINILGLQAWFPIPSVFFGINAVTWSISAEASFYAFFPFLHKRNTKQLLLGLGVFAALGFLVAYLVSVTGMPGFAPERLNNQVWEGYLYINPIARMPEFIFGIFAYKIFSSNFLRLVLARLVTLNNTHTLFLSIFEIGLFFLFGWLAFKGFLFPVSLPLQVVFNQWFSALCFCSLLVVTSISRGFLCQFLSWPPLVCLGEISFGLYLYHQPIMVRAAQVGGLSVFDQQLLPARLMPVLAWSLVVSMLSFFCLEKPAQSLLRSRPSSRT